MLVLRAALLLLLSAAAPMDIWLDCCGIGPASADDDGVEQGEQAVKTQEQQRPSEGDPLAPSPNKQRIWEAHCLAFSPRMLFAHYLQSSMRSLTLQPMQPLVIITTRWCQKESCRNHGLATFEKEKAGKRRKEHELFAGASLLLSFGFVVFGPKFQNYM